MNSEKYCLLAERGHKFGVLSVATTVMTDNSHSDAISKQVVYVHPKLADFVYLEGKGA